MTYKYFYIKLLIRVVLIVVTSIFFAFEFGKPLRAYTTFLLLSLIIIQSISLIYFLNKINRDLMTFFASLKDKDSTFSLDAGKIGSYKNLYGLLNETADILQSSRLEAQKQYQFLQFVIENASIGLIAVEEDGKVLFVNKPAKDSLKLDKIEHVIDLKDVHHEIPEVLQTINPGTFKLLKAWVGDSHCQFLMRGSLIRFQGKQIRLVAIQNIKSELDEKEMESWQKLIRVLTHEIMNSITPITNLTYSIHRTLKSELDEKGCANENLSSAIEDIEIIERRSHNLLKFVENYRSLTKIGNLKPTDISITLLLTNIERLLREEFAKADIKCVLEIPTDFDLRIDEKLFEQALINLVKNAIEALNGTENPAIKIFAQKQGEEIILKIEDNGEGIADEKLEQIFIPFYSTKENGSGIGLSLVKQIIRLHGGDISCQSEQGKGTVFIVKL